MNLPFSDRDSTRLEQRLRAGAPSFAPAPPPELRGRILAALRAAPALSNAALSNAAPSNAAPSATRTAPAAWRGNALTAAAALFVLASAWWLTRVEPVDPPRAASVVTLSRGILDAGTRVLALPSEARDNLRLEAARMLSDTTRVAEGVVRGLPAPLRARFERM